MSGVRILLVALAAWTVVGAVVLLWVGPILRRRASDEEAAQSAATRVMQPTNKRRTPA